jgi:hypothetical protein
MKYFENNIENNYESDNESDLDISWVEEQEKLQHINENYFKEPMENIDIYFIYINTNDYIEKVNHIHQEVYLNQNLNNNSGIIHNDIIIQLIEKNKYLSNNKYKILDVLLYNVSLNPENIQSYSKDENLLESSSKFLEPLSIVSDFIIPPSIFIFHKINSIFFIFKQLQEIKPIPPKSILKSSIQNNEINSSNNIKTIDNTIEKHKFTKKVRISEKNVITKLKHNNKFTRKQKK